MNGFLTQLLARDPRKEVRFPDVPLDQALLALQRLQNTLAELKAAPPPSVSSVPLESMPPVIAPEPAPVSAPAPVVVPAAPETDEALVKALASLATQVWRARAKILDPETGEPRDEMRRIHRHIEAAFDVFQQMGLTLSDWVRQPYDAGLPVKVLTFQPTPGILRDTVLEAVRPTVIWKDRILQLGEVIVGIPPGQEEKL